MARLIATFCNVQHTKITYITIKYQKAWVNFSADRVALLHLYFRSFEELAVVSTD
jgi:hypothetical protein